MVRSFYALAGKYSCRILGLTLALTLGDATFSVVGIKTGKELMAQSRSVTGRIVDAGKNPIPGASIVAKGTTAGVIADSDGNFSLPINATTTHLTISYIGLKSQEIELGNRSNLGTIVLEEDKMLLNEVVVTALGIERSSKSLTYSTQKIGSDQINQIRDANFTNTLSGKIAGLTISQSANGPGGSTRILLRGNRSIQGTNNALIVVDGVAIDNQTISGQVATDFGGQNGSDGVSNINPDDIESINVLKGAAGAALYGSRASNGVLLITTKKGKAGKINVDINSGVQMDQALSLPALQNQYSQGTGGTFAALSNSSWGAKIQGQNVTDWTGKQTTLQAYPNNIKDFFRNAYSSNNSVSVSGGSEKIMTYFSYANSSVNGIVPKNRLNRNTFNGRIALNLSKKLSVDAKVTYMLQNIYNKPGVGGDGFITANLYRIPRTVNLEDVKNYKVDNADGTETPTYWTTGESTDMNPYWTVNRTARDEGRSRVTGLVAVKYELTDWLSIQGRISSDQYNDYITQKYAHNTKIYATVAGGYYSEENDFVSEKNMDVLLSGNNKIGDDFKITYNVGGSILNRYSRRRVNAANGLRVTNKFDLTYATNLLATTATSDRDLQSVYGTAQLGYKDYLFLDLTARNDWSSTLPSPYSYFYPSVGLSAVISDMVTLPTWVSSGRVRASYSKVGNDSAPYLLSQNYNFAAGSWGGYIYSNTTKLISDLKPELTNSIELGTDWRFKENRLGVDVTYYKTNSINQLINISAIPSSGYLFRYINAGDIQNTGVELVLSAKPIVGDKFNWNIGLNYAKNVNKVKELHPNVTRLYLGGTTVRTATPVVEEGGSYGDLYGYTWQKLNGKYVVNANGVPVQSTAIEKIGNFNPKFSLGFTNSFSYKKFSLNVLVDGKFGGEIVSGSASQAAFFGNAETTLDHREGSWVLPAVLADGTANSTPITAEKFWTTVSQGNYAWGQFFVYDATNVRLRELSLGYDLKILPKFVKAAKLSLVARNLFFIYRGSAKLDIPGIGKRKMDFDPEITLSNSNYQGLEYNNMPSTRSIGANLKLSF